MKNSSKVTVKVFLKQCGRVKCKNYTYVTVHTVYKITLIETDKKRLSHMREVNIKGIHFKLQVFLYYLKFTFVVIHTYEYFAYIIFKKRQKE